MCEIVDLSYKFSLFIFWSVFFFFRRCNYDKLLFIVVHIFAVLLPINFTISVSFSHLLPLQVVDIMRENVDKVLERDTKLAALDDRAGWKHISQLSVEIIPSIVSSIFHYFISVIAFLVLLL